MFSVFMMRASAYVVESYVAMVTELSRHSSPFSFLERLRVLV